MYDDLFFVPQTLLYRHYFQGSDVALLRLSANIAFNQVVSPICLPPGTSYNIPPEASCFFAGWGKTTGSYKIITNNEKHDCHRIFYKRCNAPNTIVDNDMMYE